MSILSLALLLLSFFIDSVFSAALPVETGKTVPRSWSQESTIISPFARATMTPLQKRQHDLRTGRAALMIYHCPISGQESRTFKFEALYYATETTHIILRTIHNIDVWGSINVVTNDFSSHFYARHAEMHQGFCCIYSFKVQVIGAVFQDYIAVQVMRNTPEVPDAVKISELCVHIPADLTCPIEGNPVIAYARHDCTIIGVVMGDA